VEIVDGHMDVTVWRPGSRSGWCASTDPRWLSRGSGPPGRRGRA
jgi:hypothetical protein